MSRPRYTVPSVGGYLATPPLAIIQRLFASGRDIAGWIQGASEGAGLGNAFVSHIQGDRWDLSCRLRAFDAKAVTPRR